MNSKCSREAPLPDDVTVCPDCGFDNENIEQLHVLTICEACGEDNSQASMSCWNCNTALIVSAGQGDEKFVCAGCGRPISPLTTKCPTCGSENVSTTDDQLVQCEGCDEFNDQQNVDCWSCGNIL